jgi:hypothetical protein
MRTSWRDEFMIRADRCKITRDDAVMLLHAARVLQTWAEHECNGEIQRDETTNKPFRYYGRLMDHKHPVADRETPCMKRVEALAKRYGLGAYFQGDPRGAMIQLYRPGQDNPEVGQYLLAVPS